MELMHNLLGLMSGWCLVKFIVRVAALTGQLQRMCCSSRKIISTSQKEKINEGCSKEIGCIAAISLLVLSGVAYAIGVNFVDSTTCMQPCADLDYQRGVQRERLPALCGRSGKSTSNPPLVVISIPLLRDCL